MVLLHGRGGVQGGQWVVKLLQVGVAVATVVQVMTQTRYQQALLLFRQTKHDEDETLDSIHQCFRNKLKICSPAVCKPIQKCRGNARQTIQNKHICASISINVNILYVVVNGLNILHCLDYPI